MGKFETGKYVLDLHTRRLFFLEDSISGIRYRDYAEALEAIRAERDKDVRDGDEAAAMEEGKVFLYFVTEWDDTNACVRMLLHASWAHDKEVMRIIHDYDDRILFIG